ncbi:MAG: low temperature requirement protein A [Pseudonocardiales bacterium]|nr:MAG: low temperature requirement protein A [Pseudonocardiales bacterium]
MSESRTSSAADGESLPAQEKRVSSAELFFDLVFVFAVTELSALLGRDHSWAGLLRALVLFVPIYWMWVGTAIQTNLRDISRPGLRVEVFAVALAAVFMALALPEAYGHLGLLYALAYWAGRVILGAPLFRSAAGGFRRVNPYTVSIVLTGPLLIVGALCPSGVREGLWGLAALLDLATPTLLRSRLRGMRFDAPHLAERFSLFVLIALGESVVAIGASAQSGHRLNVAVGCAVAAAFALSCGLWWVYFHFAADAIQHALQTAKVQVDITRLVLSYGHLSFIAAIILVAVGMRDAVALPGHALGWGVGGLLYGGVALYLATFGFTRWAMFRLVSWTRLTAAAVVAVSLPVGAHLPALAALAGLALTVGVLNAVELMRVARPAWRTQLFRRRRAAVAERSR